jgi:hypothetical protein
MTAAIVVVTIVSKISHQCEPGRPKENVAVMDKYRQLAGDTGYIQVSEAVEKGADEASPRYSLNTKSH